MTCLSSASVYLSAVDAVLTSAAHKKHLHIPGRLVYPAYSLYSSRKLFSQDASQNNHYSLITGFSPNSLDDQQYLDMQHESSVSDVNSDADETY